MAAKSKKRKSTKQTKKNTQQSFVRDEIIIWVTLAVSILMLISNFGIGGFVGEAISDFLFRIFGWIAFVMPFILFGAVAFVISNKGNLHAYMKVATCLILMVLVCTFLRLVDEKGGMLEISFCGCPGTCHWHCRYICGRRYPDDHLPCDHYREVGPEGG